MATTPGVRGVGASSSQQRLQRVVKHKRRYCKTPGCTRIVKSQGVCQRHGAVAKRCCIPGCNKQAQGNFDRMCSTFRPWTPVCHQPNLPTLSFDSHFLSRCFLRNQTESHFKDSQMTSVATSTTSTNSTATGSASAAAQAPMLQPPVGVSTSPSVLPTYVGSTSSSFGVPYDHQQPNFQDNTNTNATSAGAAAMRLIQHLKDGFTAGKPPAWHRNEERLARGLPPLLLHHTHTNHHQQPCTTTSDLEEWERELAWMEILVLGGSCSDEAWGHWARAWGRDFGFHHQLVAQYLGHNLQQQQSPRNDNIIIATSTPLPVCLGAHERPVERCCR